jgi:uncharacterized protein (DUF1800 family)
VPGDLTKLDPAEAWQPFEPTAERPWNRSLAAHFARRAGFGASRAQLDAAVGQKPAEWIDSWFDAAEPPVFQAELRQLAQTVLSGNDARSLGPLWLYRLLATPAQLREKMVLFWHGHFATSGAKVQNSHLMLAQNERFRYHALGDFNLLVQEVSRDPAMLLFLDSATNRKARANENYARELMELYCLGEGNYSEKDVQELARCFTGWEVRRGQFRFNPFQHDTGTKTVLGSSGNFSGEEGVKLVLAHPAAPRFLARKLVRYFVLDEPELPDRLIEPLAAQFRADGLQARPLVRRILGSRLFFSELAVARKVRSPVEMAVGLLRSLEGTTDTVALAAQLSTLGQELFYPPSVKGWDGGRAWINSSTLLGRANAVHALVSSPKTRFAGKPLGEFASRQGASTTEAWVKWLEESLLATPLPDEVRGSLVRQANEAGQDDEARCRAALQGLAILPEFQLA